MSGRRRSLGGAAAWLGDGMQFVHGGADAAGVHTYRAPPSSRLSAGVAAAVFAAVAAGGLALPALRPGDFGVLYLTAGVAVAAAAAALWLARLAWRRGVRIRVEPDRLLALGPGTAVRSVAWDQVGRIRERPLLQRLDVVDRRGRRVLSLDYGLEDFSELAERVGRRVAREEETRQEAAYGRGTVFQRRAFDRWAPLGVAAGLVGGSLLAFGGVLLVVWAALPFCLGAWVVGWRSLRIERGELVVEWPLRRRRIAAERIADVRLLLGPAWEKGGGTAVSLLLADGRRLLLEGAGPGGVVLHAAVRRLVEAEREMEA